MKNAALMILALCLGTSVFANKPNAEIVLLNSTNKSIEINYLNFEPQSTTISITEQSGKVLFQETKRIPGLLPKKFEFDQLKGNSFEITIENRVKKVRTDFQLIQGQAIQLNTSTQVFKPSFTKKGKQVWVNLLNPSEGEVTIKITNKRGTIIVPTIHASDRVVKKIIDFSNHPKDAVITVENRERHVYRFNQ